MGASVRVEDEAFSDPRLELLGSIAGYNRFEAMGRMTHLWRMCTHRETHVATEAMVVACLGDRGVDAVLGAELAERCDEGIRIRGTKGRIEWLASRRRASTAGGEAKRAKTPPKKKPNRGQPKPNGTQTEPNIEPSDSPLTLTPSASSPVSPAAVREETGARSARHRSRQAVIDSFHEYFVGATGSKPTWTDDARGMIGGLVDKHGEDECLRRLRNLKAFPPAFPGGVWDVATFSRHFDKIAVAGGGGRESALDVALRIAQGGDA